jgi:hypothetical protein
MPVTENCRAWVLAAPMLSLLLGLGLVCAALAIQTFLD